MSGTRNRRERQRLVTSWDNRRHTLEDWQARRDFEIGAFGGSNIEPRAGTSSSTARSALPPGVPFATVPSVRRPRGRPRNTTTNFPTIQPPAQSQTRDTVIHFRGDGEVTTYAMPPPKRRRLLDVDEEGQETQEAGSFHDFEPRTAPPDGDENLSDRDDGEKMNDKAEGGTSKRKWYNSSDDPMQEWMPWRDAMILETLRRHGLGNDLLNPCCVSCQRQFSESCPLYRCRSCGDFLECDKCCVARHERSPCHVIQVWRGAMWDTTSLHAMGHKFQLGHGGGRCAYPEKMERLMTVLHTNGVHTVRVLFCRCSASDRIFDWQQIMRVGWYPATTHTPQTCATMELLSLYRRLKSIATVSVRDFVTVLERMTNPYGTDHTPDRYKAFGRMSRQVNFMQRARRSGIVYEEGGLDLAGPGSIAVECWACPRVGVNMPDNWDEIPVAEQYKYRRIVSVDANFKLKCKMRAAAHEDPPLYSGLGVQVPFKEYHDWLRSYITDEEVSSCIAFAALLFKDTKFSTGLRWTGVVGVACTRHEIMLGMGDLEKGERYKNTDFVLHWVLCRMGLKQVTITYDIACQYRKNFFKRVESLPDCVKSTTLPDLSFGLPIWHGNVHEISCETKESMKYQVGVGKSDGEGIERYWHVLNGLSYITREEQPGARHDDHEDKMDQVNFEKNIGLGNTLIRRLRIATEERGIQVEAFLTMNESLDAALASDWKGMVNDWLEDSTKPSPYAPSGLLKVSEQKVRAELQKEEGADDAADEDNGEDNESDNSDCEEETFTRASRRTAGKGKAKKTRSKPKATSKPPGSFKRISGVAFIIMGLQLEETKARLLLDRSAKVNLTLARESKIHERSKAFEAKVKRFRVHQMIHMPGAVDLLEEWEGQMAGPRLPEETKLFLPSECMAGSERVAGLCADKLYDAEVALRKGKCHDAMESLRGRLMARRHFKNYRNAHVMGQRETSRAATLIVALTARVEEAAAKYRRSRSSLVALVGADKVPEYKELLAEDIALPIVEESDAQATKKLSRLGARQSRETNSGPTNARQGASTGESRHIISWIWSFGGGPSKDSDAYLHECVRIEWAKALARKTRWTEECAILKAEMRRVLRTLEHDEGRWQRHAAKNWGNIEASLAHGASAYARRQAYDRHRIATSFKECWLREGPSRGQKAGPVDAEVLADVRLMFASSDREGEVSATPTV